MSLKKEYEENGYIVATLFSEKEVDALRKELMGFVTMARETIKDKSLVVYDFLNLDYSFPLAAKFKDDPRIHKLLDEVFGSDDYRYLNQNNFTHNRIIRWHKDTLTHKFEVGKRLNPWSTVDGERFECLKVGIYLQDHSNNDDCLHVVPGSHKTKRVTSKGGIALHPKKGDVLIFDQRISHSGMRQLKPGKNRLMMVFGFGKNNIFSDQFEAGTKLLQVHLQEKHKILSVAKKVN